MKRKDIVKIDNEEVVLNSSKEFNEFKRRYNKYDFMQKNQINTWETKLKQPGSDTDPEPTIRDVMAILAKIIERLDKHEERMNKHWGIEN